MNQNCIASCPASMYKFTPVVSVSSPPTAPVGTRTPAFGFEVVALPISEGVSAGLDCTVIILIQKYIIINVS